MDGAERSQAPPNPSYYLSHLVLDVELLLVTSNLNGTMFHNIVHHSSGCCHGKYCTHDIFFFKCNNG
jgi:hypothetical protein